MGKNDDYAALKTSRFGFKVIFGGLATLILLIYFVWWALYPLRNHNLNEVGLKFIKNNATIKEEAGEITSIEGFGLISKSRSQKIAEAMREGRELSEIPNNDGKFRRLTAEEAEWHSARITGTKKTIEVNLRLPRKEFGEYSNAAVYFKVAQARYRDESGNWQEIPIGWFENDRLLFK